jgi:hypothetical protein
MSKLEEHDVSPEDLPEGRILPGDARHSLFNGIFLTDNLLNRLCGDEPVQYAPHQLVRALARALRHEWNTPKTPQTYPNRIP